MAEEHVLGFESYIKAKETGDEDALRGYSLEDSQEELTDIEIPAEGGSEESELEIKDGEETPSTETEEGSDEFDAEWGNTEETTEEAEGGAEEAPAEKSGEQSGEAPAEEAEVEEFSFEDLDNA